MPHDGASGQHQERDEQGGRQGRGAGRGSMSQARPATNGAMLAAFPEAEKQGA